MSHVAATWVIAAWESQALPERKRWPRPLRDSIAWSWCCSLASGTPFRAPSRPHSSPLPMPCSLPPAAGGCPSSSARRAPCSARLRWRCGGRGGRFPATPLPPEHAVYARWLKAARETLHRNAGHGQGLHAGREALEAGQLLAVVSQSAQFGGAFQLEAMATGHEALAEPGLWAAPVGALPLDVWAHRWERMAGLRCVMDPLCLAPSVEQLVEQMSRLPLAGSVAGQAGRGPESSRHSSAPEPGAPGGGGKEGASEPHPRALRFSLSHEATGKTRLAPGSGRWSSLEIRTAVADLLRGSLPTGQGGCTGAAEEPGATRDGAEGVAFPRMLVLETSQGYAFGPVVFAPPPQPQLSFRNAPHHWSQLGQGETEALLMHHLLRLNPCVSFPASSATSWASAGLPDELAAVVVNICAAHGCESLLDPCCGQGSILFQAARRWGMRATGMDLSLATLEAAAENLRALGVPVRPQWGPSCPVQGPHNPRQARGATPQSNLPADALGARPPQSPPECLPKSEASYSSLKHEQCQGMNGEAGPPVHQEGHTSPRLETPQPGGQTSASSDSTDWGRAGAGAMEGPQGGVDLFWGDAKEAAFSGPACEPCCVASNLPFGRFLRHQEEEIAGILGNVAGRARRNLYVFISGECIRPTLAVLSFEVLWEVALKKRWLTVCRYRNCKE